MLNRFERRVTLLHPRSEGYEGLDEDKEHEATRNFLRLKISPKDFAARQRNRTCHMALIVVKTSLSVLFPRKGLGSVVLQPQNHHLLHPSKNFFRHMRNQPRRARRQRFS